MRILMATRITAWAIAATIVVLSVVPVSLRPETGAPSALEHFVIYASVGFAFGLSYLQPRTLLTMWLVTFAGCIEILQLIAPGRHARVSDFLVDSIAVCLGLLGATSVRRAFWRSIGSRDDACCYRRKIAR